MACVCSACGSSKSQVRDTDSKSYGVSVKRIRQCCDCHLRFETYESVDRTDLNSEVKRVCQRILELSDFTKDIAQSLVAVKKDLNRFLS